MQTAPRRRAAQAPFAVLAAAAAAACSHAAAGYTPGLGEIMSLTQMRHQKLWLAGEAGNWPLASYELDELAEGFQDVVAFHPALPQSSIQLTQVVPAAVDQPIAALKTAVAHQDRAEFTRAFDGLTASCNTCHVLTSHGFNLIVRPAASSFPNQDFRGPAK